MILSLPDELEGFVRDKVNAGSYANEEEVVRAAVSLMKETDGEHDRQLTWLRQAIDKGWDQAQAGNLLSPEEVWARLEEHKRKWHASRALNE
jgi:putative addiction module CopG family antidote